MVKQTDQSECHSYIYSETIRVTLLVVLTLLATYSLGTSITLLRFTNPVVVKKRIYVEDSRTRFEVACAVDRIQIFAVYFLAMNDSSQTTSKEDNGEANNNKKDSVAEKSDKLITRERKMSQTKDSVSEVNIKDKGKKSKTCSIL